MMQALRNRLLVLFLLLAFSMPQVYSSLHAACHDHQDACVELNDQHYHEYHPDCNVCDHVLPAIYPVVFSEGVFVFSSKPNSIPCWYNQPAPGIYQELTLFRGPPSIGLFC